MNKREWVTPEGLRGDGRRARELRRLRVELGVLPHADGSACVEMGNTKVWGWEGRGREREGSGGCIRAGCAFGRLTHALPSPSRSWQQCLAPV